MKPIVPLTVISICAACSLFALSASAMDDDARLALIDRELSCVSTNVKNGIDWNDVCATSSQRGTLDKDRMVTKSMDQMIEEHSVIAQEMAQQTHENMLKEHGEYADQAKSVDDVIAEQGIMEGDEGSTAPANANGVIQDDLDSTQSDRPQYTQYARNNTGDGYEPVDFTPQGSLSSPAPSLNDRLENQNKAEVGFEYNRFRYVEPIFDLVDKGNLFGGYINYTARPAKSDSLYDDIADVYKVETRFNYGQVDYRSSGSGTLDGNHDFTLEGRILVGKDYAVMTDSRLTPYLGFGVRYLNDDSSGRATSTGALGYDRESRYFYIPIGVEFTTRLADGWLVAPNLEYDIFVNGTQTSHLSDVNAGFPDIKNKQRDGFGMRGSLKFIKQNKPINLVVEPYIRYWHIDDSDETTAAGPIFLVTGLEPENKTTEYGVKLGIEF